MEENNLKAKIEAALFLTEKPLKATAVAKIVQEDLDKVRQTILELIRDYEERDLGLEISDDSGYIIQVKDQYATLIDEFVPLEIPTSLIRTLSAIAIKQPVMQSEIIKIRGAGAYEHIKELMERELVNKKEDGRSPTLTTTKRFQEYFQLSKDGKSLRQVLIRQDKEQEAKEAEEAAQAEESNEIESLVADAETFDASPGTKEGEPMIEQQSLDLGSEFNTSGQQNDNKIEPQQIETADTVSKPEEESEQSISEDESTSGQENDSESIDKNVETENKFEGQVTEDKEVMVENVSMTDTGSNPMSVSNNTVDA